jgi:hypothetical protein
MTDYNRNPNGLGGFQAGQASANPGGRLKSQSRVLLWFLGRALEAGEIIVDIARNAQGTKAEQLKLAACREILDRGLGKAPQSVDLAVDLSVNKRLNEMSTDELLEFKQRYIAMTTAAPALIEQVLADDQASEEQSELDLNEGNADTAILAEEPAPFEEPAPSPRRRGRPRRQSNEEA